MDDHDVDQNDQQCQNVFNVDCPVCLSSDEEMFITSCSHKIHLDCAKQLNTLECPICRKIITNYPEEISISIEENRIKYQSDVEQNDFANLMLEEMTNFIYELPNIILNLSHQQNNPQYTTDLSFVLSTQNQDLSFFDFNPPYLWTDSQDEQFSDFDFWSANQNDQFSDFNDWLTNQNEQFFDFNFSDFTPLYNPVNEEDSVQ